MIPDTSFTLRPALAADQPAIRALIHAVGINPIGLDWRRFILAVDDQGGMIGCGQVKPHGGGSSETALELASIAVRPAWRRRGVARAVITSLIETHPGTLYLTCRAPLGILYEKFRFKPIGSAEMPPYFRRLRRLVSFVQRLFSQPDQLLVMRRN